MNRMTIIVSIWRRVKPAAGKAWEKLNHPIDYYDFSMWSDLIDSAAAKPPVLRQA